MKTNLIILLCCVAYALGDKVSDAINDVYNHNYPYVTFTIDDYGTALTVERKGDKSESLMEFVNNLPKTEPRYVLYDFKYESNGSNKQRFLGICWAPDISILKKKLQYVTFFNVFKFALKDVTGIRHVFAYDVDEFDLTSLIDVAEE